MKWWSNFLATARGLKGFLALQPAARNIVFYAESADSRVHFEPILRELKGVPLAYLTSDADDPMLRQADPATRTFYVGEGVARTYLFQAIQAKIVVMTMPDLETFFLKRSRASDVHYCYVFHSMVSSHMIYTKTAFWHYDSILCVGPHHVAELQQVEREYGLKPRQLLQGGYARLDSLRSRNHKPPPKGRLQVLVAPSWGPTCLLESCGPRLVRELLAADLRVLLRPHPMTLKRNASVVAHLRQEFSQHPDFSLDTDIASEDGLLQSHIMISDWSGAALEYALGLERPVLFVDVPRKVNNADYERLGLEPLEVSLRASLGGLISPATLGEIGSAVRDLCDRPEEWRERLASIREKTVFNVGNFGRVAADFVRKVAAS